MRAVVVTAAKAAWAFLKSPYARRIEYLLVVGVYEAIRASLGSA